MTTQPDLTPTVERWTYAGLRIIKPNTLADA